MILTVTGWRHWQDGIFVVMHLNRYLHLYGASLHVRVGCAPGVDQFTREWLEYKTGVQGSGLTYTIYEADWDQLGKAAGPIRNGQMLRGEQNSNERHQNVLTDQLLAFPQPGVRLRSPGSGTAGCIFEAHELSIGIDIPGYKGLGTA